MLFSAAQARSSFKWLDTHTYIHINHTQSYNRSPLSYYLTIAALKDFYSKLIGSLLLIDAKATPTNNTN